jgi:hypothetical protein
MLSCKVLLVSTMRRHMDKNDVKHEARISFVDGRHTRLVVPDSLGYLPDAGTVNCHVTLLQLICCNSPICPHDDGWAEQDRQAPCSVG